MFKNYKKRSMNQNIFKSSESLKKDETECLFLNKYCLQKCYCERSHDKNIIRYFIDRDIYDWEVKVYLALLDKKLTPTITIGSALQGDLGDQQIVYHTSDKISVYNFLLKNKDHTKFILNEIYSFVKKFNKYNFLHGNLHLHNIFVNPETFLSKGKFYVIDYSNSYLFKTNRKYVTSCPEYDRVSFVGEYQGRGEDDDFYIYWDFFTLYVSLKMFLKNDGENLVYLENLVQNYMSQNIIKKFIAYIS